MTNHWREMIANANIHFEDWEAEQMKDPEFRAAVEELGAEYQIAQAELAAMMTKRYWLTGIQLRMISDAVRQAAPSLWDSLEVCDLLKQIEYDQLIEEEDSRERLRAIGQEGRSRALEYDGDPVAGLHHILPEDLSAEEWQSIILGEPFSTMKLWQHEETGRITASESRPSKRWFGIPVMYEDELPEDIAEEIYSWWFDNSFVDGVRIGPKISLANANGANQDG